MYLRAMACGVSCSCGEAEAAAFGAVGLGDIFAVATFKPASEPRHRFSTLNDGTNHCIDGKVNGS